LHEDVRTAAISESLVGNHLPQKEPNRERIIFPGLESGIEEDESQGTGSPVVHFRIDTANQFFFLNSFSRPRVSPSSFFPTSALARTALRLRETKTDEFDPKSLMARAKSIFELNVR
jgi:hypothetical protein